jgi:hypothetical protein
MSFSEALHGCFSSKTLMSMWRLVQISAASPAAAVANGIPEVGGTYSGQAEVLPTSMTGNIRRALPKRPSEWTGGSGCGLTLILGLSTLTRLSEWIGGSGCGLTWIGPAARLEAASRVPDIATASAKRRETEFMIGSWTIRQE